MRSKNFKAPTRPVTLNFYKELRFLLFVRPTSLIRTFVFAEPRRGRIILSIVNVVVNFSIFYKTVEWYHHVCLSDDFKEKKSNFEVDNYVCPLCKLFYEQKMKIRKAWNNSKQNLIQMEFFEKKRK